MEIVHLLQGNPVAFVLIVGLFSLMIGSFLNVVILRLPVMMERQWRAQCAESLEETRTPTEAPGEPGRFNLATPRSRCPHCGHAITALENVPILSYLMLRGRCSGCGAHISARYPLIEAATAVLSMVVAWKFGVSWETAGALALTWALIALSVIDFDRQLLPDAITLPFLWLGLGLSLFGLFADSRAAIVGALAGYLSLWAVYWLFKLLTGKEGMGYGDFKLLAMLGAWLGWTYLLPIVLLSSLVGAVVGITLVLVRGRDRNIPIPFGPYLATAGWIALLWGREIIDAYWGWMGVG
ncbi:MAG: prepilin peptidase [Gammaproteobacteria bacterium]|nr:prepilin peptidase [Gammaproteobacteria bacterium]